MRNIIDPIDKDVLINELKSTQFLRDTRKGGNQIFAFCYHQAPNLMLEVARLREVSFRAAGGGSNSQLDIDTFDIMEVPYQQLIVWDPKNSEIIGGYRYFIGEEAFINPAGRPMISMADYFKLSPRFVQKYLPRAIELGRAFVQPSYQSTRRDAKSIFALDNLWDGLGALCISYPRMKYFFGKVTTYRHFNPLARNLILQFLHTYFPDREDLLTPVKPLEDNTLAPELNNLFRGNNYKDEYRLLIKTIRQLGENLPPMISAYMNLSSNMKVLGTTVNKHFGDVDETAILITIKDIHPSKALRHIETYVSPGTEEKYALTLE